MRSRARRIHKARGGCANAVCRARGGAAARLFVCSLLKCRGPHVRWIHRKAMRSITSVMPAMKDITAQAMNAISAITGPLEGAIGPTGSATQRPFAGSRGRPRPGFDSEEGC